MARARNIKPGLCKNEDLAECSIWARYIFAMLPMLADREGRLEDRPKRIKAELLPFDAQDMEPLLAELADKKDAQGVAFIIRYQNSDGRFIQITKFLAHQKPHYSEKESTIKPHDFEEIGDDGTKPPDDSGIKPENSGKVTPLRGGRNSLNTDSLNPSSLNAVCVCSTPAHTQVRDEYLKAIRTSRADLDPDTIFQEFRSYYTRKCEGISLEKWRHWLDLEKRPRPAAVADAAADPDSRASIEAQGCQLGIGLWDQIERWDSYKARVRGFNVKAMA